MSEAASTPNLCEKIAQLARQRGWNIEDFARQAHLHRLTARQILRGTDRRLHNTTVSACAQALGFSVLELQTEPVEKLLSRQRPASAGPHLERPMPAELRAWLERYPQRAAELSPAELDELVSQHGIDQPLTTFAIAQSVERIERRRRIARQVVAIAGTEYVELLEQFVALLFEKVQPYPDRTNPATPKA